MNLDYQDMFQDILSYFTYAYPLQDMFQLPLFLLCQQFFFCSTRLFGLRPPTQGSGVSDESRAKRPRSPGQLLLGVSRMA